jgi:hypothetical protein
MCSEILFCMYVFNFFFLVESILLVHFMMAIKSYKIIRWAVGSLVPSFLSVVVWGLFGKFYYLDFYCHPLQIALALFVLQVHTLYSDQRFTCFIDIHPDYIHELYQF